MATLTTFLNDIVLYGGDEVTTIGDSSTQFINWVDQAVVNRAAETAVLINKWTTSTITFAAEGYELALPTDWDNHSTINLYTDSDHVSDYDDFNVEFGVIRFKEKQGSGVSYYTRYRQMPTVYTAMTDTLVEAANPRLKKILMDEVISMYLSANDDLELGGAESNELTKADRNS